MNLTRVLVSSVLLCMAGAMGERMAWGETAPVAATEVPKSKFVHEQDWLLDEMARDVAEMILFAKDPVKPVAAGLDLTVSLQPDGVAWESTLKALPGEVKRHFTLTHHLWAPENFSPWASALLDEWKVTRPQAGPDTHSEIIGKLTTQEPVVLMVEAKRLAKGLTEHPLDAGLHEEAAVLLGSFALRESAGPFSDIRLTLSRLTAHLAVARALQPKPGTCGQLADAILLTLVNRQVEALEQIDRLPPDMKPWATALRLRCTGDWRLLTEPQKATFLEQSEGVRARAINLAATGILDLLKTLGAQQRPEWSRLVMDHGSMSVGEGHLFAAESLGPELKDLATDWNNYFGAPLTNQQLMLALNDTPAHVVVKSSSGQSMEVLGWGDWGAFHQRHVCLSLVRTTHFLRNMLGDPEGAQAFDDGVDRALGGLRLFPLAGRFRAHTAKGYEDAMTKSAELCVQHPEQVTPFIWHELHLQSKLGKMPKLIPVFGTWFSPALPFGVALDLNGRCRNPEARSNLADGGWDKLKETAPYDWVAIELYIKNVLKKNATAQQIQTAYGKVADYRLRAMTELADASREDPAAYQKIMKKVCDLDPNHFFPLARYLAQKNMEEEAAAAYQAGIDKAFDRVTMSYNCDWLIDYYFKHGRKDDAVKVAQQAAEVYSEVGLETMAKLMERMEKYDEAAKYFGAIDERYRDTRKLSAFFDRRKLSSANFMADLDKITRQMFPGGMEKTALRDLEGRPKDGAELTIPSDETAIAGMHKGDVVVAVDGFRVHSLPQYLWVRGLSPDPGVTMIVWNGSEYEEIKTQTAGRRLHCQFGTYVGK